MTIGIGINAWVWTAPIDNGCMAFIRRAAQLGFDCFEIPLENPAALDPKAIREALRETGLRATVCGAFGPTRDLAHDDAAIRQESLDYIHASLKLCSAWGVKVMAGPMYSSVGKRRRVPPEQRRTEWQRAVSGLREAGKIAGDYGVRLALEPINRFETDLINTCEQCVRLVDEIARAAVGIHLDTFHMNIEERSLGAAVRLAGKRLCHVHACENDRGAPGTGHVRWAELAAALRETGYGGDVVIESFTPACESIAAAAAIWRPLAATQDELAAQGLAFLRKLFSEPNL